MKTSKRWLAVALSTCLAMSAFTFSAFAEETRTRLTQVTLNLSSSAVPGTSDGTIMATSDQGTFQVTSVDVLDKPEVWSDTDTPTVKITLTANQDYYFPNANKSVFLLTGKKATYVTSQVQGENKEQIALTVKMEPISHTGLAIPSASWKTDTYVAQWEPTFGAVDYQIRLMRGEDNVGDVITTKETSYDFTDRIDRTGGYTFQVRAVDKNYEKGEWTTSDKVLVTITEASKSLTAPPSAATVYGEPGFIPQGEWKQDETGWWYQNNDGTYPKDNWLFVDQKWYYFDGAGYMKTGWVSSNGKWYYCDESGAMLTSTTTPDGFYVNADGVLTEVTK